MPFHVLIPQLECPALAQHWPSIGPVLVDVTTRVAKGGNYEGGHGQGHRQGHGQGCKLAPDAVKVNMWKQVTANSAEMLIMEEENEVQCMACDRCEGAREVTHALPFDCAANHAMHYTILCHALRLHSQLISHLIGL